jgi:hypothetical protein
MNTIQAQANPYRPLRVQFGTTLYPTTLAAPLAAEVGPSGKVLNSIFHRDPSPAPMATEKPISLSGLQQAVGSQHRLDITI